MTGTSDTHLDLDRLADLLAGEGPDADVAHVERCAGCAGRLDELAGAEVAVAAALATLPAPPMPPDLVERLTAAFAAEPALPADAGAGRLGGAGGRGEDVEGADERDDGAGDRAGASRTVTPFPAARRRPWPPLAAAAALLVAAGTLGGVLLLADRGSDTSLDTAVSGGGQAASDALGGLPTSSTGRDYGSPGSLAAALPELLDGSAPPAPAAARAEEGAEAGVQPGAPPAPLTTEGGPMSSTAAQSSAAGRAADPLARLRDPAELASCLTAVLPPEDDAVRPVALDYAAYEGQPALVIVLPAQNAPEKVDVFVVDAGCAQGRDGLLFFNRLDRP